MLCCPPLSVLYFSGLLPLTIHGIKDGNMMYEVFLGDFLPRELGTLLRRTGKYHLPTWHSSMQKQWPKEMEGRKGGRAERRTERDKERKKDKHEELLGQNSEGRSLQTMYSESISRLRGASVQMWVAVKCYICCQRAPRKWVVWDRYHLQIYMVLSLLPIPASHTSTCPGCHSTLVPDPRCPISAAGRAPKISSVEVREMGEENHFSPVVIFAVLNNRRKCYYEYPIIQTHPLADFTLVG